MTALPLCQSVVCDVLMTEVLGEVQSLLHWICSRPLQLDALCAQHALVVPQQAFILAHLVGFHAARDAERRQQSRCLADVPFHRVQAETTVGDVRGADVLARREQVAHPHG